MSYKQDHKLEINELNDLSDMTMFASSGKWSGRTLKDWNSTGTSAYWSIDNSELLEAINSLQQQKECRIPMFKDLDETDQYRLEQIMQSDTVYVREVRPDNDNARSLNGCIVKVEFSNTEG